MTAKPDLSALIGSRICHDLIGPIGAIGNGVELLAMDQVAQTPELALIAESVSNASARIRFFRIAFGHSTSEQRISRNEVQSILADLSRGGRLKIHVDTPSELSRGHVKLVFLLVQCLETAMAYGGTIQITNEQNNWEVQAEAARMRIEANLWEILTERHPPQDIAAGHVHFALVPETLHTLGLRLVTEIAPSKIRLTF